MWIPFDVFKDFCDKRITILEKQVLNPTVQRMVIDAPKIAKKAKTAPAPAAGSGKGEELLKALGELQPDNMTPMDALNLLYEWKKRF